jgi:hypothetical protein
MASFGVWILTFFPRRGLTLTWMRVVGVYIAGEEEMGVAVDKEEGGERRKEEGGGRRKVGGRTDGSTGSGSGSGGQSRLLTSALRASTLSRSRQHDAGGVWGMRQRGCRGSAAGC